MDKQKSPSKITCLRIDVKHFDLPGVCPHQDKVRWVRHESTSGELDIVVALLVSEDSDGSEPGIDEPLVQAETSETVGPLLPSRPGRHPREEVRGHRVLGPRVGTLVRSQQVKLRAGRHWVSA